MTRTQHQAWPELRTDDWLPTYATLHRWTQIVGKTRLALAPAQNHWWHCTLYVSARGLTTSAMPIADGNLEIDFDFIDHVLTARTSEGQTASMPLEDKSVAQFYQEYRSLLAGIGQEVRIHPVPNEIPDATPFADDHVHATYDRDAVERWWNALISADHVLKEFRGRFTGKSSPSHFWWGAFDLACTRFSGRPAPVHPGGIPNCPDYVMAEAYSHECISAGWWPGSPGSPVTDAAFYAYAYPEPLGCNTAHIEPAAASYQRDMREWILPYDAVRSARDPEHMVMQFLESTYEAAATRGKWDIAALESKAGSAQHRTERR